MVLNTLGIVAIYVAAVKEDTIIDLGKKLGLGETDISLDSRNVIVNSAGSSVGLLVEKIGDVVEVNLVNQEPPPANMCGIQGEYFVGVYKMDNALIGILDTNRVLSMEE
jgi:purine-binding chemotaxis protein CheW